MNCPHCKTKLEKAILSDVEIDYCPDCFGMFFEKDELRIAKDERDEDLRWIDIDIWKDPKKFRISKNSILCPVCQLPLYEVNYGDSQIKIDVCNICQSVWLDRGEFKKIIEYLQEKAHYEILANYFSNLIEETKEILVGPEILQEEVLDLITILKLLNYKFAVQFPFLFKIISSLPK